MTNREIAQNSVDVFLDDPVFRGDQIALILNIEGALNAKDAALLEADKNGYERGRKEEEALLRECKAALDLKYGKCDDRDEDPNSLCKRLKARLAPSVSVSEGKP